MSYRQACSETQHWLKAWVPNSSRFLLLIYLMNSLQYLGSVCWYLRSTEDMADVGIGRNWSDRTLTLSPKALDHFKHGSVLALFFVGSDKAF
jgi:hypothetical protein